MSTPESNEPPKPKPASPFPVTTDSVWQQVHDAGSGDLDAIGRLCTLYRDAIFAYVRRWRPDYHEAEDLTQTFLSRIMEKNPFSGFERRETKFRSFLLRCLANFLRDDKRAKRLETEPLEDDASLSPAGTVQDDEPEASALDTQLALEIHLRTAKRLEDRLAAKGMAGRFAAMKPFLFGTDDRYATLTETLGMTPGSLRKAMFDLREDYHDGFREAVSHLVTREEIVGEMKYLLGLLAQLPPETLWPNPGADNSKR